MFGVAVNHYWREGQDPAPTASAQLAMSLLLRCTEITEIIAVDAGPSSTPGLDGWCATAGIDYLAAPGGLSFPDAFNAGVERLSTDWVTLLCSDVYVLPDTFSALRQFIGAYPREPIGCLIPYLSTCAVETQVTRRHSPKRYDARVPVMSTNLNVFSREVYKRVGGLSPEFSGNYNDVAMSIELKRRDLGVYIAAGAFAHHYGALTQSVGSDVALQADRARFEELYPEWVKPSSLWGVDLSRLIDDRALRTAWRGLTEASRMTGSLGKPLLPDLFQRILRMTPSRQRLT